ncbi:MAG TPA: hypothetical protein VFE82_00305 [Ramlibacter sp.]|jgi:hypothetical protein|uniref:hypothetical protein n=1 Tax=Ramlibacter sp. TaxID=1917967 RepID=UPI002D743DF6|nr:hypothetical protein [Ramlibacter sp.]HZY16885.1 hypothetical protein [Ramlibacter sp.]
MHRLLPAGVVAVLLGAAGAAQAQPMPDCPAARTLEARQLVGLWRAQFEGLPQGATLLLEPHPQYPGSLSGEVNRNGERSRLAADLEDGELTLEESADGRRIAATWLGELVEGSCGREIRGSWQPRDDPRARGFVLRKVDR